MSTTFRPYAPDQMLLLPADLRAWLPEGHLAHHVSDLGDGVDLTAFYAPYAGDGRRNAPSAPRMMVKVLLYAYATGVFSAPRQGEDGKLRAASAHISNRYIFCKWTDSRGYQRQHMIHLRHPGENARVSAPARLRWKGVPMRHLSEALRSSLTFMTPILSALALATACATPPPEPEPSDAIAYEGGRIIVGNGDIIENGTLLVEEGRLAAVGEADTVEVPANAERVDLTGRTVMPAIIDTHVHLREARDELIDDLQRKAYYGVGVVLSLGRGASDTAFEMRDETLPNAARYRTVGRGITGPEPGRTEVPYWVTTEEEARAAVRELATQNVDWVKIWVDERNGQVEKLPPELYGAVIDEAHQQGLRVTAHVYSLEDAKGLLRAGLDGFAHGIRDMDIDDEVVELFRERPQVLLAPNLPNPGVATDLSWLSGTIAPDQLEEMQERSVDRPEAQEAFGIQARNLARLAAEGVTIAFGTDGSAGWSPHAEMEDMVRAGMAPADVLVAATGNSAALVALDDVGTLEAQKSADFVVLEANPLDDITNTRQIVDVYLRGEPVDREGLSAKWLAEATP